MRILITGATGFLGRATVRELAGAGHTLRAIVLDAGRATNDLAGGRLANLPDAGRLDFVLTSARSVDATRSREVLGLTYRPLEETFADTIRWWASHGVIDAGLAGRLGTAAPAEGAA